MQRLTNPVRRYEWGTTFAIAALLNAPPDGEPQAELWLGAHPDSPSMLADGTRLDDAVRADPVRMVGPRVLDDFGGRLPFLLKFLSAAKPLSLQVHPTQEQAAAGFEAETRSGVPADSPRRRYHDPHHKPELVVALTPFEVLSGLRPTAQTRSLLDGLDVDHPAWPELLSCLERPDEAQALAGALAWLLRGDPALSGLLAAVVRACRAQPGQPSLRTVVELAALHPGDAGVLVSLLLHRVSLIPGDALYLPAGNLHAYLSGTALEVMACSDNVVRAGLTHKHVDVDELLRLVDLTPRPVPRLAPEAAGPLTWYRPGAAEFQLVVARVGDDDGWVDVTGDGGRVLLVLDGALDVRTTADDARLSQGQSVFVPHADGPIRLRGKGSAVVAAVPSAATSR